MEKLWQLALQTLMMEPAQTSVQEVFGTCHRMHSLMYGVLPKRILQLFNWPLLRLQETQTSQETGIWTTNQRSWTWRVHPSCSLYNWWHGKGGNNFLQMPCRDDSSEKATPLSNCDGMAEVPALLCLTQSIHHVHSRQQILFHRPIYGSDITLATYEGWIPSV